MKIDRLLAITTILLNKGTATAGELADKFEVSKRTIYRDIECLAAAGIPVYTQQGTNGGIAIMEDFTIAKLPVKESERESLMLALQSLTAARYPGAEAMLTKLSSLFKSVTVDWVMVDFTPWGSPPQENEKFQVIRESILGRQILEFDYVNAYGQKSSRTIEPMTLVFKSYGWYLWGFCRLKEDFRTFKITRMKNLRILPETFNRRDYEKYQRKHQNDTAQPMPQPLHIRMKFLPRCYYRVFDMFDEEMITRNDDFSLEVVIDWPLDEWVYSTILSFGSDVEILEPESLKQEISTRLASALAYYQK